MAMLLTRTLGLAALVVVCPSMGADVSELKWMAGCWAIEENEAGSGEMWTKPMGNMLFGVGYTSKNGMVSSYEHMRIEMRRSGDVYFVAKPSDQSEAEFKMTETGKRRVVFENPTHDFPQRISYRLESEGVMKAKIEAEERGEFKGFELTLVSSECNS